MRWFKLYSRCKLNKGHKSRSDEAELHLKDSQDKRAEVEEIVEELRAHQLRNHLAERVAQALGGGKP